MKFNLIAAVCENQGIGINGVLPWHLKNELKYFNRMTKLTEDPHKKNALIMGRKTFFGIPENKRPLPDRINIILSTNIKTENYPENVILCCSLEDAVSRLNEPNLKDLIENVWIVGGSSVYKEAMESSFCNRLYLTRIKANFECDTFFPEIPKTFRAVNGDENVPKGIQEENGIQYEFLVFQKD